MLLKNKPKLGLQIATYLCEQITDIGYHYKNNEHYIPTQTDIKRFQDIVQTLSETHSTLQYITHSLQQRCADNRNNTPESVDEEEAEEKNDKG